MKKRLLLVPIIVITIIMTLGIGFKTIIQKTSLLSFLTGTTLEEKELSTVANQMYVTMLDDKAKVVATTNPNTQVAEKYVFSDETKPQAQPNTKDNYFILFEITDTNGSSGYTKVEENVIYTLELPEYITPTVFYDEGIEPNEQCTNFTKKGQTVACGGIYKKGNKNIKLDTSKRAFDKVLINKNKVIYQTAGNCIEIKKNGKKRKIIARDIDKLIEVYKNKYLILKNNTLYLNNKLLDKKVNEDSITIIKNKIYYLKSNDEIYELVKSTTKKSKIINKNVIDLKSIEDNIYYLGDFNLNYRYGNIYTIKGKNKIAEKVSTIIDNE